ncbi:MAG TPA: patatin-like phospholipase family protein [Chloroflexia bacterium]|nr:patatin-like phospholipase family protein [Chloroflexia bacterium]
MAKTQVALVLAGGASLGAYIAGALDELLSALRQSEDYEIDIVCGASAGALTAALLAHALCFGDGAPALHRVWVEQVDMADLLTAEMPDEGAPGILSGARVSELVAEYTRWPDSGRAGRRAAFCAPGLRVAMTLTNLTALPYPSRVGQPASGRVEPLIQYRNAEQQNFRLGPAIRPTDPLWQEMGAVVRASAAAPYFFPPVRLRRRAGTLDDDSQYIEKPLFDGEAEFWYTDGAFLNTLPVDLAWYFAQQAGGTLENRRIVVIRPTRTDARPVDRTPSAPGLLAFTGALLAAGLTESSTQRFEHETLLPPPRPLPPREVVTRDLPGVDPPPVELLERFALVIPRPGDRRLRGTHLNLFGGFLDQQFREYDFRRGAADARRLARDVLGIRYSGHEEAYYVPDADLALRGTAPDRDAHDDIPTYADLDYFPSSRFPGQTVRAAFEAALDRRIAALVRHWDAPGPDMLIDPFVRTAMQTYVRNRLPMLWG